ncbi:OprO/OprP family phosphate-selective porin [Shewanella sp. D64]|uniref:porin n=1 Tax=unclassified Shewanella TaxID=196818 RepID=UPI0022BA405E|nr:MULTISPECIES: porin [unclassified Shewanella]MEC4724474.1 OprO/OprP family phosphate-selective porin [Shewanella sp. D64]MEC4736749.1 OprO/OprP family phosphate-selective porin [Shewanella sp. E94]WBJ94585.1 OprO/OprP family phosphate-selective porin [Shewanella sp. MTB7]
MSKINMSPSKLSYLSLLAPMLFAVTTHAHAGGRLVLNENAFIDANLGLKASVAYAENQAPNGKDNAFNFDLESARFYLSGQLFNNLTFEFTTDYSNFGDADNNSDLQLLDASVNYQFSERLNVKAGRFIRPMDRSNQAGPYFSNTWDYPVIAAVNGIAPIIAGRDEGVVVWGYTNGGKFKYYGGIFEGVKGGSNQSSSPLLTTRLEYNFWDPEPGYYSANAHYGDANIFALGFNYHTQDDAISAVNQTDNVTTTSVDLLIEKVLNNEGVATLEAAFYDYDYNELSTLQGDAYLVSISYLFPASLPSDNRFQILARHQRFNHDDVIPAVITDSYNLRNEIGLNYIINGHSAKLSLVYANEKIDGGDNDVLRFGVQFQTF